MAKPLKPNKQEGIITIDGKTNILLIAPHGVKIPPRDDIGTAELAERIQKRLGCSAIINTIFRKPKGRDLTKRNNGKPSLKAKALNLNLVEQARQLPEYINKIEHIVESKGHTYVFWIHGIDDGNIPSGIDCFIGYGQPNIENEKEKEERFTAREETIQDLIQQFQTHGITAAKAPANSRYRGWKTTYMNQWCRRKGLSFDKVQSIQLEFKKTGFRGEQDVEKAAGDIANAISALVQHEI